MENRPLLPTIHGLDVGPQSRCRHWHGERDVVAMRLRCCEQWWACIDCHAALADHPPARRALADPSPAALCGACGHAMTAAAYLACDDACPACGHGFNPGCRLHRHLYFEVEPVA